ncbi:MAG TPA: zf-TFIIB domain-containing protein [Vicinamibacterales bacterium]|nr:zf-TFIIB domain-containing protein [Vicinamibacterales bacterium]
MTCPKCSSPMEVVPVGDVEVDRCTACGGLWFDLLEEEAVKREAAAAAVDTKEPASEAEQRRPAKRCPRCHVPLLRMVDAGQPHVWYESCAVCFGSFFDAGEFRDLADESVGDLIRSWRAKERR